MLTQCLAHALDERIEFGVWGGLTERERRAMLRRRPDVTSWEPLLRAASARVNGGPHATRVRAAARVPALAGTPAGAQREVAGVGSPAAA